MIFQRYLFREIVQSLVGILFLLIIIFISMRFVQYLADAAAGKISGALIFSLLGLRIVTALVIMLPLCLYLSIYLVLTRLDRDSELIAMHSFGLGTPFLTRSVVRLALIFAGLVGLLSFFISPWAEGRLLELEIQAKLESDITGIGSGRFKEFSAGDRVLYVERIADDRATMNNIFLQVRDKGTTGLLTSRSARMERSVKNGDRYVVFGEGQRYMGEPGQLDYSITEFQSYGFRYEQGTESGKASSERSSAMSELVRATDLNSAAELQWRLAMPITAVILALLAVNLVRVGPQRGRYAGLLGAVIIYFGYSNLIAVTRTLIKRGEIPAPVGMWTVHLLALVLLAALFYWHRWRWRRKPRPRDMATPV